MKTSSIILIASFVIGILIISILVIQNPPKNSVGVNIFDPNQKSHLQQYWEDAAKNSQNTIIIREQREIEMRPIITSGEIIDIEKLRDPKIEISGLKSEYAKDEPIHFEVLVIGDGSGCGGIQISIFREFKIQPPIFSQNYISICDGSGKFVATPISASINSKDGKILHLGPGKYVVDASYYQDRGSFGQREQSFQITKLHVLEETSDVVPRPDLISQKHLTVEGLNETYGVGQKIEFTVKYNGTKSKCPGYPSLHIETSDHKVIWESGTVLVLCDPDIKPAHFEKTWAIGNTPLGTPIINKTGHYTLFAEFENNIIQRDFWVNPQIVDVVISPKRLEYDGYSPTTIKVKIDYNNTVRWTNHGKTPAKIDADTAADLDFFEATNFDVHGNSFLALGKSFEFTFNKEGTFGYHGKPWQRGTVIVLPPDSVTIHLQIQRPDSQDDTDYSIKVAARKGYFVSWDNIDNKTHTITSKDLGKTFDSGLIPPDTVFTLDTSDMEHGYYQYYDKLNPELSDTIRIIDPAEFDDDALIENTKNIKEVKEFLKKYPQAFSHVDHDYYDMVSYGMINKIMDDSRSMWLRVIFDESGNVQRTSIDCGFGGMSLETPNVLEYLKTETCLEFYVNKQ